MSASAITLEVLPAGFGDCLLLTCISGRKCWRMLVDTGPDEAYPLLRKRLLALPVGSDGHRHIDLFVVTHIGPALSIAARARPVDGLVVGDGALHGGLPALEAFSGLGFDGEGRIDLDRFDRQQRALAENALAPVFAGPGRDQTVVDASHRFVAQGGAWVPSRALERAIEEAALGQLRCLRL